MKYLAHTKGPNKGCFCQDGDALTDFRGDKAIFRGEHRPPEGSHSTGRVITDAGEFYPHVFDLEWLDYDA